MDRKFSLTDLQHHQFTLKSPLEVSQQRGENDFVATAGGFEGRGLTWPDAMRDLQDVLVGAAMAGRGGEVVVEVVVERPQQVANASLPEGVGSPVAAGTQQPTVYVLLEEGKVMSVKTDLAWAKRWARWNPKGSYQTFVLDAEEPADEA